MSALFRHLKERKLVKRHRPGPRGGGEDAALNWLETALEERDGWLVYIIHAWPRFEELRDHPRFQAILRTRRCSTRRLRRERIY